MQSILALADHTLFANAVLGLLNRTEDLEVAMAAPSAEDALLSLRQQDFDLAVVDLSLPHLSCIAPVRLIHERDPAARALPDALGASAGGHVQSSLQAGARGQLLEDRSAEIIDGIRHVLRGETYVSEELRRV